MFREQVLSTLRFVMPSLRANFGKADLSLFGSISRGDDTPQSDGDIIVKFESPRVVTRFPLASLQERHCDLLGREMDVGTMSSRRPRVRAGVEAE